MEKKWYYYTGLLLMILGSSIKGAAGSLSPTGSLDLEVGKPIKQLPNEEMIGKNIDSAEIKLCATLSKCVYDLNIQNRGDLEGKLKENKEIMEAFPNLNVRWFQNGGTVARGISERVSFDKPTFTAVIIGDTLILCWRGTVTVQDVIKDLSFESTTLESHWGKTTKGLEVQSTHAKMIKSYLKNHIEDIQRKIICTGHSLGGGLAQVAHLLITLPGSKWSIADDSVIVETVAFSAPMTIIVKDDDLTEETETFLEQVVKPNMRNIVFNDDIVPRYSSNFPFLNKFIDEFDRETMVGGIAGEFMDKLVDFCKDRIEKNKDILKNYRHIRKLIYYANYDAAPEVYEDWVSKKYQVHNENEFNSLTYEKSEESVVNSALNDHMALIKPGLTFNMENLSATL